MVRRSKKIGRANIALGHCDRKKKKYEELKICAGIASEKLLLTGMGLHITRIAQVLIETGDKWIQLIPAHFYYESQYKSGFDGPIV